MENIDTNFERVLEDIDDDEDEDIDNEEVIDIKTFRDKKENWWSVFGLSFKSI